MKKALIIVNMQNDLFENGPLAVPGAAEIVPYVNSLISDGQYDEIILMQEWHPANHKSFATNNGRSAGETVTKNGISQFMWPSHCVQNTNGAEFHPDLKTAAATYLVRCGQNSEIDSHSAFRDNNNFMDTGLDAYLAGKNIQLIEVCGLALEHGVKNTCIDAATAGYITCLHFNGNKPANNAAGNAERTIYELIQKKVSILA